MVYFQIVVLSDVLGKVEGEPVRVVQLEKLSSRYSVAAGGPYFAHELI